MGHSIIQVPILQMPYPHNPLPCVCYPVVQSFLSDLKHIDVSFQTPLLFLNYKQTNKQTSKNQLLSCHVPVHEAVRTYALVLFFFSVFRLD